MLFSKAHPSASGQPHGTQPTTSTLTGVQGSLNVGTPCLFFCAALPYNHVLQYGSQESQSKISLTTRVSFLLALSLTCSPCWVNSLQQPSPVPTVVSRRKVLCEIQVPRILWTWHSVWFPQTSVSRNTRSPRYWLRRKGSVCGFDKPMPVHRYAAGGCQCIYSWLWHAHQVSPSFRELLAQNLSPSAMLRCCCETYTRGSRADTCLVALSTSLLWRFPLLPDTTAFQTPKC